MNRTMPDAGTSRRLVLLVAAAVFINYIDRGNLATGATLIQDELQLSASQLGFLLSAFYYGYIAFMAPAGWLAERYGAHRVLAIGLIIWSIATLATGFAQGFAAMLVLRVLLGIGESVSFPCASKVLANSVKVQHLGVANGVLGFGYLVGPGRGHAAWRTADECVRLAARIHPLWSPFAAVALAVEQGQGRAVARRPVGGQGCAAVPARASAACTLGRVARAFRRHFLEPYIRLGDRQ